MTSNILTLPAGPSVPYSVLLDATRQTFIRLGYALTGRVCIVTITPTAGATAGVEWTRLTTTTVIKLHFPSMPPHVLVTRGEAYRLVGLLVHELMHVYATNNTAWIDVVRARDVLLQNTVNALEDCRIEALAIREAKIPAARDLFATLSNHFLGEALRKGFACRDLASLPYALAVLGRVRTGQKIPAARAINVAPAMRPAVDLALATIRQCRSTAAVITLARAVLDLARNPPAPPPPIPAEPEPPQAPPQEPQEPQEGEEGPGAPQEGEEGPGTPQEPQDGPGEGEEGEEGPGEGEEGEEGPGEPQEGPGAPGEGEEGEEGPSKPQEGPGVPGAPGEPQEGEEGPGAPPVPGQELADTVREIQERTDTKLADDVADIHRKALGHHLSQWRGVATLPAWPVMPDPTLVTLQRAIIPNPGAAKATIRRLLKAPDAVATEHRLMSGRLDRRALARIPSGAKDVFARRVETDATNVGVVLIVDNSTSMMDTANRLPMARALALHFGEACQGAGAESAIITFHASNIEYDDVATVRLRTIKAWHERIGATVNTRIASLNTFGGTPLSHSIMHATDMLGTRRELTRRIVLTLTDGECVLGPTGVKWACSYAKARGTEVIGVVLEHSDPAGIGFPTDSTVAVADAADLTQLALRALAKALGR